MQNIADFSCTSIKIFPVLRFENKISALKDKILNGNYDWYDEKINAINFSEDNFDDRKRAEENSIIKLVNFGSISHKIDTNFILKTLNSRELEPANIFHILEIGIKIPDLQRQCAIIALGSLHEKNNYLYAPCLDNIKSGEERALSLVSIHGIWLERFFFAAIDAPRY